jgi:hypothetical protein
MSNTLIEELLVDAELNSKLELIEVFKKHFEDKKSTSELKTLLGSYLAGSTSVQRSSIIDRVTIHGPRTGLSCFVANQLYLSSSVETFENKLSVVEELKVLLLSLNVSNSPLLTVARAKALMKLLQNFLGDHFGRISYHRLLSIFFIPYESKLVNAAFDSNTNSIAVFRTKDHQEQTPEYIFLHEFGHAIHCRLFKYLADVPESFLHFMRDMDLDLNGSSKEERLEIYADFFSIAVMNDSDFEIHNPFLKTMQPVHLKKIKEYFKGELSTAVG